MDFTTGLSKHIELVTQFTCKMCFDKNTDTNSLKIATIILKISTLIFTNHKKSTRNKTLNKML